MFGEALKWPSFWGGTGGRVFGGILVGLMLIWFGLEVVGVLVCAAGLIVDVEGL
jgi:hypothetical protein